MCKYWAARHWAAHGTGPHGTEPHGTGPIFFRNGAASGPSCHTPPCYLLRGTAALAVPLSTLGRSLPSARPIDQPLSPTRGYGTTMLAYSARHAQGCNGRVDATCNVHHAMRAAGVRRGEVLLGGPSICDGYKRLSPGHICAGHSHICPRAQPHLPRDLVATSAPGPAAGTSSRRRIRMRRSPRRTKRIS